MKIEKWMKQPVVTAGMQDNAEHVRELMTQKRINQLPVVHGSELVGIVTDRDVRDAFPSVFQYAQLESEGRESIDPAKVMVEDLMERNVLTLGPNDSLHDAVDLMLNERIGSVPITDDGKLVGILARSDVLRAYRELVRE